MKKLYLLLLFVIIFVANAFAEDIKVTYTDTQGTWEFTILTHWDEGTSQNVPYAARLDKVTDYTVDDITIPTVASYEGVDYPVEQIGERVFQNNRTLSNVVLPATVKSIGGYAFNGCSSLKEVLNTLNCESVGILAFTGCGHLTSIDLSSCKIIGDYAFEWCGVLQSLGSLSKIEYVGNYSFYSCSSLGVIDLPAGVEVREHAFDECKNLVTVGSLENSKIGSWAFRYCEALKSVDLSKAASIGEWAFEQCSSLESVGDLSTFTSLENHTFVRCSSLTEVNLSSCKVIGSSAFEDCTNLSKVTLGACADIGSEAFRNCAFQKIDLSTVKLLGSGAFRNCKDLEIVSIPNVKIIEGETFAGCSSIKSIDLSKVVTLGGSAFSGCSSLKNVDGFTHFTEVPDNLFNGCESLETIDLSKVETIGIDAFSGCKDLKSVYLPACLSLGIRAFINCIALESVNLPLIMSLPDSDNEHWHDEHGNCHDGERGVFTGCTALMEVKIPSCKIVGTYAFYNCSALLSVDTLKACETISDAAFQNCGGLKSINLSKVLNIGSDAFNSCTNLTSIDLTACQTLGNNAFSGCSSITKIDGFGHFTEVPAGMFKGMKLLESIDLSKIESIGNSAFEGCSSLTTVDLTACKSLGTSVFSGCSNLKTIKGFTNIIEIPDGLFNGLHALESIDLSNVEKIGNNAFSNCVGLTALDLSKCKTIGKEAFFGCSGLKSLELTLCEYLGGEAFMNCDSLTTVNLPVLTSLPDRSEREWYDEREQGVFYGCKLLKEVTIPLIKTVGSYAFYKCSELTSVGTLDKCDNISAYAFSGCNLLGDMIIGSTSLASIGENAFTHTGNITFMSTKPATITNNTFGEYILCLVPADALETYQAADKWYDIRNRIFTIGDKFNYDIAVTAQENGSGIYTAMGEDDLRKAVSLKLTGTINSYDIMIMRDKMPNLHYLDMSETSVLENSYEYYTGYSTSNDALSTNSFSGLGKIVTVKLPKTLKYLGDAFRECKNLRSIEMYDSLNTIGGWAFYECENLNNIVLPKNLKTISDHGFARCYSLQKIVMPEGLTRLDSRAFEYCSSLTDVTFPSTLETIGGEVFYECSALNNVVFPSNSKLTAIEGGAFERCYSLPGIKLPNRLSIIGKEAFESCHNLKELNIPSSVTEIQDEAFYGCGIRKVYTYTVLPTKINQNTFSNYENAVLYIPDFSDSRNNYYFSTGWSQFSKLEPFDKNIDYDYFYLNEDYTLDEDRIEGDPDADVNPGGGLIVEGDDTQNLSNVTISNNNNGIWGAIIGNSNISANLLKFEVQVQGNKWYFFSFPYDIKMSNIDCQSQFLFRYYDGEARAENGSGGWKDLIKGSDVLERGKGYIFQCSQNSILKITIETPTFDAEDFKQALSAYAADNAQDAGWNFVGNPYTSYFDLNDTKYSAPITVWNQNTNSYEALRPGDDDYNFHPFQAFFVQKPDDTGEINFDSDCRTTYTQAEQKTEVAQARRMTRGVDENRLFVELTIAENEACDKTRIVFNEKAKVGYEIGCDAAKFISSSDVPQIYSVDGEGNKYAINERPSGEVKIAYQVNKAGTYKIGAKRMDRFMTLYDCETKTEFDFSNGDYSFDSEAGTFENRFVLKAPAGSSTGLAEIKKETGVSAMGCADGIYVNNVGSAQVDIYSLSGVLLATHLSDGLVRLPKATYIIKVNNMSTKVLVK